MPFINREALWSELDAAGPDEICMKLAQGVFGVWKRPLIEEWLRRVESLPPPDTFMYHPAKAPAGKLFHSSQVESLKKSGWKDHPTVPKPTAGATWGVLRNMSSFVAREWKWVVGTLLTLLSILVTYLGS